MLTTITDKEFLKSRKSAQCIRLEEPKSDTSKIRSASNASEYYLSSNLNNISNLEEKRESLLLSNIKNTRKEYNFNNRLMKTYAVLNHNIFLSNDTKSSNLRVLLTRMILNFNESKSKLATIEKLNKDIKKRFNSIYKRRSASEYEELPDVEGLIFEKDQFSMYCLYNFLEKYKNKGNFINFHLIQTLIEEIENYNEVIILLFLLHCETDSILSFINENFDSLEISGNFLANIFTFIGNLEGCERLVLQRENLARNNSKNVFNEEEIKVISGKGWFLLGLFEFYYYYIESEKVKYNSMYNIEYYTKIEKSPEFKLLQKLLKKQQK